MTKCKCRFIVPCSIGFVGGDDVVNSGVVRVMVLGVSLW